MGSTHIASKALLASSALALRRAGLRRGLSRFVGLAARFGGLFGQRLTQISVNGIPLVVDLRVPYERHVILGFHEQEVFEAMHQYVRPGDLVVDVGANVGFHSAMLASLVGPTGRVLAFEPNPKLRSRLERIVTGNPLANLEVSFAAVGEQVGTATLFVSSLDALSSLREDWSPDTRRGSVDVPCVTLDSALESTDREVGFLKIDVEGAELDVIRGGTKLLSSGCCRAIMVEFTPPTHRSFSGEAAGLFERLLRAEYELMGLQTHGCVAIQALRTQLHELSPGYNVLAVRRSL